MKNKLLLAKRNLYFMLINLNEDEITDNEVDIMYLLSKDEQILSFLNNEDNTSKSCQ